MDSCMSVQAALILTVVAIFISACYLVLAKEGKRRYHLPPGPKPWPVVGNLPIFLKRKHVSVEEKFRELGKIYGPIIQLKLGSVPTVVIMSPELAQVVLKEQDLTFATRPTPSFVIRELSYLNEGTAFSPYGPSWRFSRKVLTLELLTHKRVEQFQPVRQEEIDAMVRAIRHSVVTQPGGSVDLAHQFRTVSLNTLTRITVAKRYISQPGESGPDSKLKTVSEGKGRDMYQEVVGDLSKLMSTTHMLGDFVPVLAFLDGLRSGLKKTVKDAFATSDAFLQQMVDEHRLYQEQHPDEPPRDVLAVLLNLRQSGETITDTRIKALAKAMITGGVDTSSISLKCILAELLRQPKYLDMAHKELDQAVGRDRKVEEADLPNLHLLRAIIKESWRLMSGILIPRCSTQDTKVAGYDIPANTTVLVNTHGICHDPAVWPDPDRFYPERFLQRPEIDVKGQNFELLPFGSGRRMCPGINLGTAMVEITLARLLHSFNFSLPADPQDLTEPKWLNRFMVVPSLRLPSHLY